MPPSAPRGAGVQHRHVDQREQFDAVPGGLQQTSHLEGDRATIAMAAETEGPDGLRRQDQRQAVECHLLYRARSRLAAETVRSDRNKRRRASQEFRKSPYIKPSAQEITMEKEKRKTFAARLHREQGRGPAAFPDCLREPSNRGRLERDRIREDKARALLDCKAHPDGEQRVAAFCKEIIVQADGVALQKIPPKLHEVGRQGTARILQIRGRRCSCITGKSCSELPAANLSGDVLWQLRNDRDEARDLE